MRSLIKINFALWLIKKFSGREIILDLFIDMISSSEILMINIEESNSRARAEREKGKADKIKVSSGRC